MTRTIKLGCLLLTLAAAPAAAEPIVGLTFGNGLVSFDSASPGATSAPVAISGLQAGEDLVGLDRRPATGGLYGLSSQNRLYLIDPVTGAATQVGSDGAFALSGTSFGFDFNPTVDRIRVTSDANQNLRLNPINGALAATDGALAFAVGDPNAGADPTVAGSAYTNNFQGAGTTTLFNIDSALDLLLSQVPPNAGTLNTIGALGLDASSVLGFDISGLSGIGYLVLQAAGAPVSALYTINLGTGAASLVGAVGTQFALRDLAAPVGTPVPEPATLAMLALGLAGGWTSRRRQARARAR